MVTFNLLYQKILNNDIRNFEHYVNDVQSSKKYRLWEYDNKTFKYFKKVSVFMRNEDIKNEILNICRD